MGAALYFYAIFQICAFLLGEGALFLLGVAFLSLNPFLLDYLCLARGYSLGLAFFLYALYQLMLYLSATRGRAEPESGIEQSGDRHRPLDWLQRDHDFSRRALWRWLSSPC